MECDNAIKSIEHILSECKVSEQAIIWEITRLLHKKRRILFEKPSLGAQLGCALANQGQGRDRARVRRFTTIVVSEALRMIWKNRCK